jgi:hypothetical protein
MSEIKGSRWKRVRHVEPDAEDVAFEQRQAESRANIERLKAELAELRAKELELERKLGITDWLCYLPRKAGGPDFMQRAEKYLEEMRTRLAAEGTTMWLDANHRAAERVFLISKFRHMGDAIFCTGEWTETGRKYRHTYRGISGDCIVFAGDMALFDERYTPPCLNISKDAPAPVQAAHRSDSARGLAGAACLGTEPAYGRSAIFRLTRDKITGRERLEPVHGVLNDRIECQPFELPSELTTPIIKTKP